MNLLKQQLQDLMRETMRDYINGTTGEILTFNNETMLADVKIKSPHGAGMYKLKQVPVQIGSGGVSQAGPFIGDTVMITFQNGNINNPIVTALIDTHYTSDFRDIREKHSRKGAYCPDNICIRDGWEYTDPLYDEFIDTNLF